MAAAKKAAGKKPAAKKQDDDSVLRFTLEDRAYEIDFQHLTIGETEDLEEYFDRPMFEVEWMSARFVAFLAFLAIRRKRPDYTWAAHREVDFSAFEVLERPERPTEAPAASGEQSS